MAFEVSKKSNDQFDPLFLTGNPYKDKYHNVGQLETPYQGKKFGTAGDYAPPQRTKYYTDYNPNYPYVMDSDLRAVGYLPTEGCCFSHPGYFPCYEDKYPNFFVPPNYFSPKRYRPSERYRHLRTTYPFLEKANDFYRGKGLSQPQQKNSIPS